MGTIDRGGWLGTPAAFADFYRERAEPLLLFFARRVYDAEVALDLTAETFARAYAGRGGFRGAGDRLPLTAALFTSTRLRSLPSEPVALLRAVEAAVERRHGQRHPDRPLDPDTRDSVVVEAIRELLLLPVSPRQRAGLLRAFGLLPGTRAARIGTDARGRRGVLLVHTPRTHPRLPRVLVVDDRTGQLLADRGPRNSSETTYVEHGVARDLTALPEGVAPPKARLPRTQHG